MVEDALEVMKKNTLRGQPLPSKGKKNWSILDLGCGSGAIGISLALSDSDAKVVCSDISRDALAVAEKNADILGCKSVKFVESDMFAAFYGQTFK